MEVEKIETEMEVERVKAETMGVGLGVWPDRSGKPWSVCEDSQLKEEVNYALNRMANKHGRSMGAIVSRLKKHL